MAMEVLDPGHPGNLPNGINPLSAYSGSRRRRNVGLSWKVTSTSGGSLPNLRPVFTPDKKHFIVLTSLYLRVYLLRTKSCIRSIPVDSSDATDLYLDSHGLVWIVKSSGRCVAIDWITKAVEHSLDLKIPIRQVISVSSSPLNFVLLTSKPQSGKYAEPKGKKTANQSLYLVQMIQKSGDDFEPKVLTSSPGAMLFAISHSKEYFAFYSTLKKQALIVLGRIKGIGSLNDGVEIYPEIQQIKRSRPILSMAVSNTGIIAVGSVSGVIDLYYNSPEINQPTVRTLKWHVDSVLALTFSNDDMYLLSGGLERVLVFWQMETQNTQFLPRLGGAIENIVVDPSNELFALFLGGDEFLILSSIDLNSRLQISGVRASFTRLPSEPEKERRKRSNRSDNVPDYSAPFFVHPTSKDLFFICPSGYQLQIYNTRADDLPPSIISIAPTIQTGKVRVEQLIEDPQVIKVAFSQNGRWMATVDQSKPSSLDHLLSQEDISVNLKFWQLSELTQSWELITRIDAPHGINKRVCDLIAANESENGGDCFLTACQDGGLRAWKPHEVKPVVAVNNSNIKPGHFSWTLRRFLPPRSSTSSSVSVAWSNDSSLIVLGCDTTLFAVDGKSLEVLKSLPNILGSRVRSLHICGSDLIALSKTRLVVWDLVNDEVSWSVQLQSHQAGDRLLAVDKINNRFAIAINYFTKDFLVLSKIFILSPSSPIPLHIEKHNTAISAINLIPGSSNFIFLDIKSRLNTLTLLAKTNPRAPPSSITTDQATSPSITSLFVSSVKQVVPKSHTSSLDTNNSISAQLKMTSFDNVFEGGDYTLTNLEELFNRVVDVVSATSKQPTF